MRLLEIEEWPERIDSTELVQRVMRLHWRLQDFEEGDLLDRIQRYDQYRRIKLPLDQLDLEEFLVDEETVQEYRRRIEQGEPYPPIIYDRRRRSIVDGTHRAQAVAAAGHETIDAYVGVPRRRSRPS